jgi:5-(carboxyamino)imidazole ribonucleotide mutase
MPPGVPVATVGINAAENAALLAIQILSVKYEDLRNKFLDYKKQMAEKVFEKDKKLNEKLMSS